MPLRIGESWISNTTGRSCIILKHSEATNVHDDTILILRDDLTQEGWDFVAFTEQHTPLDDLVQTSSHTD